MKILILSVGMCLLGGCSALEPPQSLGDINAGYRYIPLDPLPVVHAGYELCTSRVPGAPADILDALPNLASRVGTRNVSGGGNLGLRGGPTIGVSGSTYEVVQDFIAYDEANLRFEVPVDGAEGHAQNSAPQVSLLAEGVRATTGKEIVVPVYVGLGLRLSATVTVRSGNVNLADLGALSVAAKADRVNGGLVVQSLGLNGPKIAATMPLPGELNATTIQNATVALGAIKALLYADDTQRRARVVGIHYPFATQDPAMIDAILAALAAKPIVWKPCEYAGAR